MVRIKRPFVAIRPTVEMVHDLLKKDFKKRGLPASLLEEILASAAKSLAKVRKGLRKEGFEGPLLSGLMKAIESDPAALRCLVMDAYLEVMGAYYGAIANTQP